MTVATLLAEEAVTCEYFHYIEELRSLLDEIKKRKIIKEVRVKQNDHLDIFHFTVSCWKNYNRIGDNISYNITDINMERWETTCTSDENHISIGAFVPEPCGYLIREREN